MIEKLEQLLNDGEVSFTYEKVDGTKRDARGSCNVYILEAHDAIPYGTGVEKTGVITYFDLDKNAWRSFRKDSLISIKD